MCSVVSLTSSGVVMEAMAIDWMRKALPEEVSYQFLMTEVQVLLQKKSRLNI